MNGPGSDNKSDRSLSLTEEIARNRVVLKRIAAIITWYHAILGNWVPALLGPQIDGIMWIILFISTVSDRWSTCVEPEIHLSPKYQGCTPRPEVFNHCPAPSTKLHPGIWICCRAPTFWVHNIGTDPSLPRPEKFAVCPAPKQICFFLHPDHYISI